MFIFYSKSNYCTYYWSLWKSSLHYLSISLLVFSPLPLPSSPYLLSFLFYFMCHHSSLPFVIVPYLHVQLYMMWFCICVSAFIFVCACVPIIPQKPLCFSSVAFSAVAKTGPSAANGGAGVGLPGHVSGWWPCHPWRRNSLCLSENRIWEHCDSNHSHVEKFMEWSTLLLLQQRIVVDSSNKLWCYRINVGNPQM